MAAARRVFERDGYFGARVADITAEAGVAHGSFYTYFASRQDVFVAVLRNRPGTRAYAAGYASPQQYTSYPGQHQGG